jgi:nucleoside-diphosphate kinase
MERTLIFLKPDAVQRGLVGEIISRFEKRGFQIAGMKMLQLSEEFVREHYAAHEGKHFYEPLITYVIGSPIVAMVLEGKNAVEVVREMMGMTFGSESPPGTIRGDYALSDRYNLVHGSDSVEAARD